MPAAVVLLHVHHAVHRVVVELLVVQLAIRVQQAVGLVWRGGGGCLLGFGDTFLVPVVGGLAPSDSSIMQGSPREGPFPKPKYAPPTFLGSFFLSEYHHGRLLVTYQDLIQQLFQEFLEPAHPPNSGSPAVGQNVE